MERVILIIIAFHLNFVISKKCKINLFFRIQYSFHIFVIKLNLKKFQLRNLSGIFLFFNPSIFFEKFFSQLFFGNIIQKRKNNREKYFFLENLFWGLILPRNIFRNKFSKTFFRKILQILFLETLRKCFSEENFSGKPLFEISFCRKFL